MMYIKGNMLLIGHMLILGKLWAERSNFMLPSLYLERSVFSTGRNLWKNSKMEVSHIACLTLIQQDTQVNFLIFPTEGQACVRAFE